jgi:hypothetical protein
MTHNKAFTLAELMVGLMLTAAIGLTTAILASGLSSANAQTNALTESVQSARIGFSRLDSLIRRSQLVVNIGSDQFTVWLGDANGDKLMNLAELVQVYYDPSGKAIHSRQVQFPVDNATTRALNVPSTLAQATASYVANLETQAIYAGYLSDQVLADKVTGFSVQVNQAAPYARRVAMRVTIGSGGQQVTMGDGCVLRADQISKVVNAGGVPTLNLN